MHPEKHYAQTETIGRHNGCFNDSREPGSHLLKSKVTLRSCGLRGATFTVALFFPDAQGLVNDGIWTKAAIGEDVAVCSRELNV